MFEYISDVYISTNSIEIDDFEMAIRHRLKSETSDRSLSDRITTTVRGELSRGEIRHGFIHVIEGISDDPFYILCAISDEDYLRRKFSEAIKNNYYQPQSIFSYNDHVLKTHTLDLFMPQIFQQITELDKRCKYYPSNPFYNDISKDVQYKMQKVKDIPPDCYNLDKSINIGKFIAWLLPFLQAIYGKNAAFIGKLLESNDAFIEKLPESNAVRIKPNKKVVDVRDCFPEPPPFVTDYHFSYKADASFAMSLQVSAPEVFGVPLSEVSKCSDDAMDVGVATSTNATIFAEYLRQNFRCDVYRSPTNATAGEHPDIIATKRRRLG